jgi:hypothetical protein
MGTSRAATQRKDFQELATRGRLSRGDARHSYGGEISPADDCACGYACRLSGIDSRRGVAEAIAVNLRDMMLIDTPIIVICRV